MSVIQQITEMSIQAWNAEKLSSDIVKGKRFKIIKTFHDQPYGRSKPDLKGKSYWATGVNFNGPHVSVWLDGISCAVPIHKLEQESTDEEQ